MRRFKGLQSSIGATIPYSLTIPQKLQMHVNRRPIEAVHYEHRLALLAEAALVQGQRIVDVQRQSQARPITATERRKLIKIMQTCSTQIHI